MVHQRIIPWHEKVLQLLPKSETHGRIFFRHIKCRQLREEAIAEMVALAWLRWSSEFDVEACSVAFAWDSVGFRVVDEQFPAQRAPSSRIEKRRYDFRRREQG